MTIYLSLYSTSHCHLCEQAEAIIASLTHQYDIQYEVIEITDNEALLALYEVRIPVLKRLDTNTEIGWPFTTDDVHHFLNHT